MIRNINRISLTFLTLLASANLHAEPNLYGSLKYDLSHDRIQYSNPNPDFGNQPYKRNQSSIKNFNSYIGVEGSEDIGNGNELIYRLEWGVDGNNRSNKRQSSDTKNRSAHMGFTGDWGTIIVGRMENPFKQTIMNGSVLNDFNLYNDY